jgi:hypothetical protein
MGGIPPGENENAGVFERRPSGAEHHEECNPRIPLRCILGYFLAFLRELNYPVAVAGG